MSCWHVQLFYLCSLSLAVRSHWRLSSIGGVRGSSQKLPYNDRSWDWEEAACKGLGGVCGMSLPLKALGWLTLRRIDQEQGSMIHGWTDGQKSNISESMSMQWWCNRQRLISQELLLLSMLCPPIVDSIMRAISFSLVIPSYSHLDVISSVSSHILIMDDPVSGLGVGKEV